jgi:hypothetical protein
MIVVDKPKHKYKLKEKKKEAKEAKVQELAKLGLGMIGEDLIFDESKNDFCEGDPSPPKSSWRKVIKVEEMDFPLKGRNFLCCEG